MRDWINVLMVRFNVHCSISLPCCARFSVGDKSLLMSLECGINCDYCQLDVALIMAQRQLHPQATVRELEATTGRKPQLTE